MRGREASVVAQVKIISHDERYSGMLVRELALFGITAETSHEAATGAVVVLDLDSGVECGADITFSRDPEATCELIRPFDIASLVEMIEARLAPRENHIREELTLDGDAVILGERRIPLTETEYRLLEILYERRGEPVSRDELRSGIEGWECAQGNICEVYIRYLREKLESASSLRWIITVRGKGYMLI